MPCGGAESQKAINLIKLINLFDLIDLIKIINLTANLEREIQSHPTTRPKADQDRRQEQFMVAVRSSHARQGDCRHRRALRTNMLPHIRATRPMRAYAYRCTHALHADMHTPADRTQASSGRPQTSRLRQSSLNRDCSKSIVIATEKMKTNPKIFDSWGKIARFSHFWGKDE